MLQGPSYMHSLYHNEFFCVLQLLLLFSVPELRYPSTTSVVQRLVLVEKRGLMDWYSNTRRLKGLVIMGQRGDRDWLEGDREAL